MLDSEIRAYLERQLPEMFQKKDLDSLTCGLLTVNNINQILFRYPDMRPFPQRRLGRKVMVKRDEFLEWLEKYDGRFNTVRSGAAVSRIIRPDSGDAGEAGSAGEAAQGKGE